MTEMNYNYKELTDVELAQLLADGSMHALREIYNRYWKALFLHALKMLRNQADAEDVVQDVFTSLAQQLNETCTTTNLKPYLYCATRNGVLNKIRKGNNAQQYIKSLEAFSPTENSTDHRVREVQLSKIIENEIDVLPQKMKTVFKLHKTDGLNYCEIGKKIGISEHTAKKQVHKALKILRLKLANINLLQLFLFFLMR